MLVSPDVDRIVRLIAAVFPGTTIWWQGCWRGIRLP